MQVSVIIPVYRAAKHVAEAVYSALAQPETAEVILAEDGSPDDSLAVCRALAAECAQVRVYQHARGRNRGAAASRNLGLCQARAEFVTFLDADDYFLPGRFTVAGERLVNDPSLDGVYEAMGCHFETPADAERWRAVHRSELTTMRAPVAPEALFEAMTPIGAYGYCPLAGYVIRRAAADRAGGFDSHLRRHDDTAFQIRLAATARLAPGRLGEPVVVRRVHPGNDWTGRRSWLQGYGGRLLMWGTLSVWGWRHLAGARRVQLTKKFIQTFYRYRRFVK
jgi:glycosyltransferase involved in cell wall biosynthesis